jgi:hypothetical protein
METNYRNLVAKLNQIVEQAQLTLQDPQRLTAERQRMIISLARFVSMEMSQPPAALRHDGCWSELSGACAAGSAIPATSAQGDER